MTRGPPLHVGGVGLVASTTREPTDGEVAAAGAAVGDGVSLSVERAEPFGGRGPTQLVLAGAAVVVALGATAIAVALAAVESRPDLEFYDGAVELDLEVELDGDVVRAGVCEDDD